MSAIVCRVDNITKHPGADRLELLTLVYPVGADESDIVTLVTGPHYREGQRGVYITPGSILPGYLAEDLWLCGRGKSNEWHTIGTKNMRGIESPGMFCGEVYQKVRDDPRSVERFEKELAAGGAMVGAPPGGTKSDWISWPFWRDHWKDGEDISAYLGIRAPVAQSPEQPVLNGQVAGWTPAGGSTPFTT